MKFEFQINNELFFFFTVSMYLTILNVGGGGVNWNIGPVYWGTPSSQRQTNYCQILQLF